MIQHVNAIYEQGVLKPLEPLDLDDQELVSLSIEKMRDNGRGVGDESASSVSVPDLPNDDRPVCERIASLAESLPERVIAPLPIDGASEHDHYIYGLQKRKK